MQRFMSSAASSSAGSAERPVRPCHLKISSIRDVQSWLAEEPIASSSSADVQRIREAAAVLSHPKPRQEDVRPLQSKWQVAQTKDKKPRPLGDVVQECKSKVIKAVQKLQQQLSDDADCPSSVGADVQNDPAADRSSAERPVTLTIVRIYRGVGASVKTLDTQPL